MNWQTWAAIAAVAVPMMGLLNAWLLVQIKVEISSLKIEMLQQRVSDQKEIREWVESEFLRRAEHDARVSELRARIDRVEHTRRRDDLDRRAA